MLAHEAHLLLGTGLLDASDSIAVGVGCKAYTKQHGLHKWLDANPRKSGIEEQESDED